MSATTPPTFSTYSPPKAAWTWAVFQIPPVANRDGRRVRWDFPGVARSEVEAIYLSGDERAAFVRRFMGCLEAVYDTLKSGEASR